MYRCGHYSKDCTLDAYINVRYTNIRHYTTMLYVCIYIHIIVCIYLYIIYIFIYTVEFMLIVDTTSPPLMFTCPCIPSPGILETHQVSKSYTMWTRPSPCAFPDFPHLRSSQCSWDMPLNFCNVFVGQMLVIN